MSQVACYASYKGELPVSTPGISTLPDGVTEIPLLRFDLNGNGIVDSEDYVIAYITGSSDWAWNDTNNSYYYKLDRYTDYRHYWIVTNKTNAMSFQAMPKLAESEAVITSFRNHLLLKQPLKISNRGGNVSKNVYSGLDWIWVNLTSSLPSFSYQVKLPDIDTSVKAEFRINKLESNGSAVPGATFSNAVVCSTCQSSTWYPFKYGGSGSMGITDNGLGSGEYFEISSLEFRYAVALDMSNKAVLTVFSPETSSVVTYQVSNLPAEPVFIVRLAADESMRIDTLTPQKGSSYTWTDSTGKGIKYFICSKSGLLQPPACEVKSSLQSDNIVIHDLRSAASPSVNQADYLVITHPDFTAQAQQLATHKLSIGRFAKPKVVDLADIYREFSGGNTDPAAIRNFLLYAHTQWGVNPDYVVLMGRGHYNFKGIKTSEPVYIPVYEHNTECIEDFFSYLDSGGTTDSQPVPKVYIGRLPCISADQAQIMVNKIISMEDSSAADLGTWRNRMLFVNDDDMQGTTVDGLKTAHLEESEESAAIVDSLRPSVDMRKVNLFEYPWNDVLLKPEARDALINNINNGTSVVNYFGHGSAAQWADESILNLTTVSNLQNEKQYPLISSYSCSVGKFDQPSSHCLSEALMLLSKGGAIGAISCTREAYSDNNSALSKAFYNIFADSTHGGVSFGEAYGEAKAIVNDGNSRNYSYLGDPSICSAMPIHSIVLDITNSKGVSIDTVKALQSITVHGTVKLKGSASADVKYGANNNPAHVQICLFNPSTTAKRKDGGTNSDPSYSLPGTLLFTGQVDVKNGVFEQTIHVPRNITFNKTGAKITAFSWQGFDNGLGHKDIVFNGTESSDSTGIVDTVGPAVSVRVLYDEQSSSDVIALTGGKISAVLPFNCEIDVVDSSGIDITGTGPDEGLTVGISGVLSKENINQKFSFIGGDYRKGSATIQFVEGQMSAGTYSLVISAQDLSGNVTRHSFTLEVLQSRDLAITRLFNYPNPMKMGNKTAFYFNLTKASNVRSTIKLYSMTGRLLRVFYGAHSGEVFDGKDQTGNLLSPKVYLYQLTAEDLDEQKTVKSSIQKLAVYPPR